MSNFQLDLEIIQVDSSSMLEYISPDSDNYRGSYFQLRGGRRTTLADWTWHQGAIAGCSGRGAIGGCHRRVPL